MDTPIIAGKLNEYYPSNAASSYGYPSGGAWQAANVLGNIVPVDGVISKWMINLSAAPGAGKSRVFTLYKNGVATSVSITISDANNSGSDLVNSFSVVAGDTISVECVPSGTPSTGYCRMSFLFNALGTSVITGGTGAQVLATSGTYYLNPACVEHLGYSVENASDIICPTNGTISSLYVELGTAPGAGKTRTFTYRLNGADQTLTVTISDLNTTGNDTVHSFNVVAGDLISLKSTGSGTPNASTARFAVKFTPTILGESIHGINSTSYTANAATRYTYLDHASASINPSGTEGYVSQLINPCDVKKLHVRFIDAPGVGKSMAYTLRKAASDTALTCTIADANVTASDLVNVVSVGSNELINMKQVPTNTPSSSYYRISLVAFILPPASGVCRRLLGVGV